MPSVLLQVADAVTKLINDHTPDDSYTHFRDEPTFIPRAVRTYSDYILELEKAGELQIEVVPKGISAVTLVTRGGDKTFACDVYVILRYKFRNEEWVAETGRIDPTIIDDLVDLTELFVSFFQDTRYRRLPDYDVATLKDDASVETVAPGDFLRTHSQFLSAIRLTYDAYIDSTQE